MSVERVREGEVPSAVIASYGFCRTTIYRWLRAAKGRGRGLAALRSRKGTGRPPKLTAAQGRQVFRWINGKDPRSVCGRGRSLLNWLPIGLELT
jgi:transposase